MTVELVEVTPTDSNHLPNGAAAAAILASGIGCTAFGVIVVLTEASSDIAGTLTLFQQVGPLSGKVAIALFVWLSAWAVLHKIIGPRQVNLRTTNVVASILIVIGFLLTFPPMFTLFGD
ncbi:MAG: hypothetical protein ACR2NP_15550 [Pirellulaceae bacterium]